MSASATQGSHNRNTSHGVQTVKIGPPVFCTAHPFTQPQNPMLNRHPKVFHSVGHLHPIVIHVPQTHGLSILNCISIGSAVFGRPFVKRFALSYRTVVCLSVCPVCNVGVLWPNGWMEQDATWCGGRPRPRRHYVSWAPPERAQNPLFSAHVYCGQSVAHLSYC